VDPLPALEELEGLYGESFFQDGQRDLSEDKASAVYKNALARLKKIYRLKPDGNLLDIGCGVGCFVHLAQTLYNYKACGIDISEYAIQHAARLGIKAHKTDLLDWQTPERFDVITMWDSIEHMKDPSGVVSKCNRLLKDRGLLVLATGDIGSLAARIMGKRWHLMIPPKHLYFFSKDTVRNLLEAKGLKTISIDYAGKYVNLKFFKKKFKESFGGTVFGRFAGLIDKIPFNNINLNLFDIMTVYAYKDRELNER
jgi:SAM-dependent methyltransferase